MSKGGSTFELSSLDSNKNASTDTSQIFPKIKGSIVEYKYRTKVIAQVVYLISFILILFSLIGPWMSIRTIAINSFNKLFGFGISKITDFLAKMIAEHLDRYQMVSKYLASIFIQPPIFLVEDKTLFEFIKYSITSYEFCHVKPYFLFLSDPGVITYQVFFVNNDYEIFVQYFENNQTVNKKYPSNYDFGSFDHLVGGVRVDFLPGFDNSLPFERRNLVNLIEKNCTNMSNIIAYTLHGDGVSLKAGVGYDIKSLMGAFESGIPNSNFQYAFMDDKGGVLYESKKGIKSPIYNKEDHNYYFPKLNRLNDPFWDTLSSHQSLKYEEVTYNEMSYLVKLSKIMSANETAYTFLLVMEKDELLAISLARSTICFIILIVLISSIALLAKFLQKKSAERCKSKLSLRDASLFPQSDEIESYSTLQNCINQIRTLQLMYPEESSLNRTLDKIVLNLADSRFFLYQSKKDKSTVDPKKVPIFENENCFHYWQLMIQDLFKEKERHENEENSNSESNSNLVDNRFKIESNDGFYFSIIECSNNPPRYLMKIFMKLILDENLLFRIFDPDVFLQFIYHFSTNMCYDCISSAFVLYQLHSIISNYFSSWFTSKFDLLIVYFSSIIYYAKVPESELEAELQEFEEEEEEDYCSSDNKKDSKSSKKSKNIISHKNKNRSKSHSKFKSDKRSDVEIGNDFKFSNLKSLPKEYIKESKILDSKIERKIEYIFNCFTKFFNGIENNDMFSYFKISVKRIFYLIQDFKMFQLLGEFRIRIESPDFSIFNDIHDKYLFFSSIIKFCQFGLYYQDHETMLFLSQNINNLLFTQSEKRNNLLLADYHFKSSSKFATYWLNCFSQFTPMKNEKMKLIESTSYWLSEKNDLLQDEFL